MVDCGVTCPGCGAGAARRDGRDRKGRQVYRCGTCPRRFTSLSATPFSGYRFPPDVIALAVRWYLRCCPWTWWIMLPGSSNGHLAGPDWHLPGEAGPQSRAGTP